MLVGGASSLLAFAAFIAPGALWTWLSESRRSVRPRSQLLEASYITLWSIVFAAPATLTVWSTIEWLGLSQRYDRWFTSGAKSVGNVGDLLPIALAFVSSLLLSLALATATFSALGSRIFGPTRLLRHSAWTEAFRHDAQNFVGLATLRLSDGSTVRGLVKSFSSEHAFDEREIVLEQPIYCTNALGVNVWNGDELTPDRIVIPHSEIGILGVNFITSALADALRQRRTSAPMEPTTDAGP